MGCNLWTDGCDSCSWGDCDGNCNFDPDPPEWGDPGGCDYADDYGDDDAEHYRAGESDALTPTTAPSGPVTYSIASRRWATAEDFDGLVLPSWFRVTEVRQNGDGYALDLNDHLSVYFAPTDDDWDETADKALVAIRHIKDTAHVTVLAVGNDAYEVLEDLGEEIPF